MAYPLSTIIKLGSFSVILSVLASPAMAFNTDEIHNNQTPLAAEFVKLDTNNNKKLTRAEASKDKLFVGKVFSKADTNHDGVLNQEEYVNYKSAEQKKALDLAIDDSVITTKAKAEMLATKGLKSYQISVETYKGEVILSGFVDDAAAKVKAEQVVAKINGVKSVKNSLAIKKE
jgi:hyperosmotically inducible protein